ncbi:hypothetical protein [Microbacterium sulfonylureivorans]|uniref:hypothetical protein n=1 Tax=Microbacterium sulfonylureivorans TaxID=2486854 RepID=UPI000FDBB0BC|nr:hypothetical protein [Microbacterium sulfonylureivorans]
MTTVEADVRAPADLAPPEPSTPRGRAAGLVLGVVAVFAAAALAGWHVTASAALASVSLEYDAEPIVCDGADVGTLPSPMNDEFLWPAVALEPGATCELRIHVVNGGPQSVMVDAVTLAQLAPGGPTGLEVSFVNPNAQHGEAVDGDHRFPVEGGLPVDAGTIQTFIAVLTFAGESRYAECSSTAWAIPSVTVSALGQSRTVAAPAGREIWFHYGGFEECAS